MSLVALRKTHKRNTLLNLIRTNEDISRIELSKITGFSGATVSTVVSKMIQENMIFERVPDNHNTVGRRPTHLIINEQYGYMLGIEFNLNKMHCVLLNFKGNIVYAITKKLPMNINTDHVLGMIDLLISECIEFLGSKKNKILGIGFGLPGYIDMKNGLGLYYEHIEDWRNIDIVKHIQNHYGVPAFIANNTDCMGFAFLWLNANSALLDKDIALISIRTGARLIPIINAKVFCGLDGSGGELGHLPIRGNNRICVCGKKGCLNTLISDQNLVKRMREKTGFDLTTNSNSDDITVSSIIESALKGDKLSCEILESSAKYLGEACISVVNLFSPDLIVLSGELSKANELFIEPLIKYLKENCVFANVNHLEIITSKYEDNLGAFGAATLIWINLFENLSNNF